MSDAHPYDRPDDRPEVDELLAAYDAQLRGDAEVQGAERVEQAGPLWRGVFRRGGFVSYDSLEEVLEPDDTLDELIAETVAWFAAMPDVAEFEWKTRGHDRPADLDQRLRRHGFEPEEVETVMVGDAALLAVDVALPDGVVVRRVDDLPDRAERDRLVTEAARMQGEVFGGGPSPDDVLRRLERLGDDETFWVVQAYDRVVSAGRLTRVPGTGFAGLWGGATLADWRGRGLYRALTAARASYAVAQGVRYLHSDCTAMSRPILERSGLTAVTTTTPYVWHRPA